MSMMRQFRLIPSGCQAWSTRVLASNGNRFAYCSTLAIYIFNLEDFTLESLIAGHERTITGLTWSPHNPNLIATCSIDGNCCVWNIDAESKRARVQLPAACTGIDWDPFNESRIALSLDNGSVVFWDMENGSKLTAIEKLNSKVRAMRWNPREPGSLAIGQADGSLGFFNENQRNKNSPVAANDKGMEVVDIQWDMLSNTYLLVAYRNGSIALWDSETLQQLHDFDRQGAGLKAVAWMEWAPGNFASVNSRTGVIRVWNVSQRQPLERIRVARSGFHNFVFIPDSERALFTSTDGSVGIFNMARRQLEFSGPPGHKETIFDVDFKPSDPNVLATASYDSTVKIWRVPDMECTITLTGQAGVIYGLSWAPGDDHRLVSSSSKAELYIWDTRKGRPLKKMKHHTKAIYRVYWNQLDSTLIASSSLDGTCVIARDNGDVVKRLRHPAAVYGCQWSPHNKDVIATGCHDGSVRIFDISSGRDSPQRTLTGHTARVFNVIWSPLLRGVVASGSDDTTVRVWDTRTQKSKVLEGHTANVRALSWSEELCSILLSGSWDGTIRVWDTQSSTCLSVVSDHHADVYALKAHPQRPFLYASSSRDTTLRFWKLDGLVAAQRLRALVGDNLDSLRGDAEDTYAGDSHDSPYTLSGAASENLARLHGRATSGGRRVGMSTADKANAVQRYKQLFNLFSAANGMEEFWQLLQVTATGESGRYRGRVLHSEDVVGLAEEQADSLEAVRHTKYGTGVGSAPKEETLQKAATLYLQMGNLERYCDIQVELGHWERALAIAPAVSLPFWHGLASRYAEHLADEQKQEAAPFYVATANVDKLVEFYTDRDQLQDAFLVAKVDCDGGFRDISNSLSNPAPAMGSVSAAATSPRRRRNSNSKRDDGESKGDGDGDGEDGTAGQHRHLLHRITAHTARKYFKHGEPVLAACCHLAVGDSANALRKLVRGGEVELAYALLHCLGMEAHDHVLSVLALRCEALKEYQLALRVLRGLRDPTPAVQKLCARFTGNPSAAAELYETANLRDRATYIESGERAEERGKDMIEAVRCYVLGGDPVKAIELGLRLLREALLSPVWDMDRCNSVMELLGCAPAHLVSPSLRAELLAYAAYFGAQRAMWKQYTPVVPHLFKTVRSLVQQFDIAFPISHALLDLEQAQYMSHFDKRQAKSLVRRVEGSNPSPIVVMGASTLAVGLEAEGDDESEDEAEDESLDEQQQLSSTRNLVIVAGAHLPMGRHHHPSFASGHRSVITSQPIQGPDFVLEDDARALSLAEAIMWAKVNPFSPLNTGFRINPF